MLKSRNHKTEVNKKTKAGIYQREDSKDRQQQIPGGRYSNTIVKKEQRCSCSKQNDHF